MTNPLPLPDHLAPQGNCLFGDGAVHEGRRFALAIDGVLRSPENDSLAVHAIRCACSNFRSPPHHPLSFALRSTNRETKYRRVLPGIEVDTTEGLQNLLRRLDRNSEEVVLALLRVLHAREREIGLHSIRTSWYARGLARRLGLRADEVEAVRLGALLHDLGKISIPADMLLKPGPLDDQEWRIMRTHPDLGWRIIRGFSWSRGVGQIVRNHHERFDGGGYPQGIRWDQIPLGARVLAIADCYDAMTSDRPYRSALGHEEAIGEIVQGVGTQFDPRVVDCFCEWTQEPRWRSDTALPGVAWQATKPVTSGFQGPLPCGKTQIPLRIAGIRQRPLRRADWPSQRVDPNAFVGVA